MQLGLHLQENTRCFGGKKPGLFVSCLTLHGAVHYKQSVVVGSSHSTCTKLILIPLLFCTAAPLLYLLRRRRRRRQACCCTSAQSVVSLSCLPAALAQYLFSPDLLCYKAKHWCDAPIRSTVSLPVTLPICRCMAQTSSCRVPSTFQIILYTEVYVCVCIYIYCII